MLNDDKGNRRSHGRIVWAEKEQGVHRPIPCYYGLGLRLNRDSKHGTNCWAQPASALIKWAKITQMAGHSPGPEPITVDRTGHDYPSTPTPPCLRAHPILIMLLLIFLWKTGTLTFIIPPPHPPMSCGKQTMKSRLSKIQTTLLITLSVNCHKVKLTSLSFVHVSMSLSKCIGW